jgi:hypothetical protein
MVIVAISKLVVIVTPGILMVFFSLGIIVFVIALDILAINVFGKGPIFIVFGMAALSSPPQPSVLSIVSSIAVSDYWLIVVSASPM